MNWSEIMAFLKFKPLISKFNFRRTMKPEEITDDIKQYFVDGEEVLMAFISYRDIGIFTNQRILLIDYKGLHGFRKTVFTVRYCAVSSYALNIKTFDSSIDITTDSGYKLTLNFMKPIPLDDMVKVYHIINERVLCRR
jgi:hypothetical protein